MQARLNYYNCFIFPYLSYNIIFWGSTYSVHTDPLFILQKRMIRYIFDADFDEHTDPLFYRLNLLKLKDIYSYFLGIYMFNNYKSGHYRTQHNLNTRNRDRAQPVYHRLTSGQQSITFIVRGIFA